jgi:Sin3 associated polypeptide p18 (SAP18)
MHASIYALTHHRCHLPAVPQVCPLLLRVFPKLGGHHRLEEFVRVRTAELDDEVQIYTWPDATLRELSDLVKEVSRGREAGSAAAPQSWPAGTQVAPCLELSTYRRLSGG